MKQEKQTLTFIIEPKQYLVGLWIKGKNYPFFTTYVDGLKVYVIVAEDNETLYLSSKSLGKVFVINERSVL